MGQSLAGDERVTGATLRHLDDEVPTLWKRGRLRFPVTTSGGSGPGHSNILDTQFRDGALFPSPSEPNNRGGRICRRTERTDAGNWTLFVQSTGRILSNPKGNPTNARNRRNLQPFRSPPGYRRQVRFLQEAKSQEREYRNHGPFSRFSVFRKGVLNEN